MLHGLRVLDLADSFGALCGQILADLGADVILVEPPGGSTARARAPFWKDEPGPERSLSFWAYARGKRSVVLDLESEAGRRELRRLARGSDFLIESLGPARMRALGLDGDALARDCPGLISVSISAFGGAGPKASYAATDLIVAAASGPLYLCGDADRAPLRVSLPQVHAHAAADAAVGALVAHFERKRSGLGQHVDVSAQQAMTLATLFHSLDAPWKQPQPKRISGVLPLGKLAMRVRYPTRDGWVVLGPGFLPSTGPFLTRLARWAHAEGLCDERFVHEDWGSFGIRMLLGQVEPEFYAPFDAALETLFAARTNLELLREAVARKLLVAPTLALGELDSLAHFRERESFVELEHPGSGLRVRYPGPFARFAAAPIRYALPPPRLGEHTREVLAEDRPERAPANASGAPSGLPLAGVKVLDFFWVLAGPAASRTLADFGATVVHVECTRRIDTIRTIPPWYGGVPSPEGSGPMQGANAGKLCITLDLGNPASRPVLDALVRWADVVTESFAPGVMARVGLDYASLCKLRPDAILISSALMGQSGELRDFAGFGNLAAAVTGFQHLAGWPDRPPTGPAGAYTDFVAARYNAIAILAALEHRERTGQGQWIDQSQAESAFHFLAPAWLDWTVNGRAPTPAANDDPEMFPHGLFPGAGEDRWLAVAVRDARDWAALCDALGRSDWRADAGLEDPSARRARHAEIDAEISRWSAARDPDRAERELQALGVPAHAVLDMPGLYADPQLRHRGHWVAIPHPTLGSVTTEAPRFRLSRTPARVPARAVSFGCDNRHVLGELLGFTQEQIAALQASGALT
ncbi:MAG TPA: CoA transferase [Myxococcota bacterium]|nr:CoA transferase [Myxococcota bacterium]